MKRRYHIPRAAERLIRSICKSDYTEEIIGDLYEYHDEITGKPRWKRGVYFWFHVFNFIKPWSIKSFEGTQNLNHYGMFKNYFKTSYRSLRKNALFSFINVVGLAISMSIGILMILVISELNSFDSMHTKADRIYRVAGNKFMYGQEIDIPMASHYIGLEMEHQTPGIEEVLIMRDGVDVDLRTEAGAINIKGFYTTESFFDIFSFELLKGNPETALLEPNGVVLTQSTARKIFGDKDPLGEPLEMESTGGWQVRNIVGIVTGVMADLPSNSHLQFEVLVSMETYDQPAISGTGWHKGYKSVHFWKSTHVYVLLDKETTPLAIENSMAEILRDYNAEQEHPVTYTLQSMKDFVTSDKLGNRVGPRFSRKQLGIMIGLTIVVLISACFNYTNLSLARALRRAKEVGIRKVSGARRHQVFTQFIVESILLSLISLILAIGLFLLIKPAFINLPNPASSGHDMFLLNIGALQIVYFVTFAIVLGVIAGILPSVFLSKLNTTIVLKDAGTIKPLAGISLRRILTVLQFALSIGLIMSAVMVNKQYQFAVNFDMGFNTERIINIKVKGDYASKLEATLQRIPEVEQTSISLMTMATGQAELARVESEDKEHKGRIFWNSIDEKYLSMHNFELVAGRGFESPLQGQTLGNQVILNEHILQSLQLGSPEEAIGKFITIHGYARGKYQVIGVVENFVNTSLNAGHDSDIMKEKNFGFIQGMPGFSNGQIGVKFRSDNLVDLVQKLETAYLEFDQKHPFEAEFYNDQIAETYRAQKTTVTLISFLAFLAISISMLGLLGMAVYITESKMKEISIRKVLGAGFVNLMTLLSRGFAFMIIIAAFIAIPITKYILDDKILGQFNYRPETNLMDLLSGFLIVLLIGFFTVTWQIRQAAIRNPSDLLRNE